MPRGALASSASTDRNEGVHGIDLELDHACDRIIEVVDGRIRA